jgi:GT2 family glycosyltransferase
MNLPTFATILFDEHSRYRACADILRKLCPSRATVLHSGSGQGCVLERFLPEFEITYVDPSLACRHDRTPRMLPGDVFHPALDDKHFDFVVSVDTLEHVPPGRRTAFLNRLSGMARQGVIIACPCADAGEALETDRYVNEVYAATCGRDYPFLAEHFIHGLPRVEEISLHLKEIGWQVSRAGNANAPRLRSLLAFVLCALEVPWMRTTAFELSEWFNRELYAFDQEPPVYRQIVVALANPEEHLQLTTSLTPEMKMEAARRWQSLEDRVQHLWHGTWEARLSWSAARVWIQLRGLIQDRLADFAGWLEWSAARLPLPGRARWLLRRAFFETVGRLSHGTPHHASYVRELEWRRRRPTLRLGRERLARPRNGDRSDVFLWTALTPDSVQDRLAGLGRGFAATGHHVFRITPLFVSSCEPGFESVREGPEIPLYRIRLHRHEGIPERQAEEQLRASAGQLVDWSGSRQIVSIVEDPFWIGVAEALPNGRLVYDCTAGCHRGVSRSAESSLTPCMARALARADLLIAGTEEACEGPETKLAHVALVPNAGAPAQWSERAQTLLQALARRPEPTVSLVIVAYNGLELTRACLESVEHKSDYPAIEVVVVDNASTDGTSAFLQQWAQIRPWARIVLNEKNRGFPAATNQGLEQASGEYFVILNNDVVVTHGWLRTLINHLRRDPTIGMIGPVTNNIGNEARVPTTYRTIEEMAAEARVLTLGSVGQTFPIRTLAFFCVMIPQQVYELAGPLDEGFGIGFFEDDDYCRRVEQLGYRIVCAEDVFVHHHMAASFSTLAPRIRRDIFEASRRRYETKWGAWTPHGYRARGGS